MSDLNLEINRNFVKANTDFNLGSKVLSITPPLDADYWVMRVSVSENQAVVAFPKFHTIGIGFQYEDDWNCNLPYACNADEIYEHISDNKGDESIPDEVCLQAISLIKETIDQMKTTGELETC